jgi:aspartate racemase
MGPESSALFYQLLTEHTKAQRDQDHLDLLIYSRASTPDRTASLMSGRSEELFASLLDSCRTLQDAGAAALVIVCNTAHVFTEDLRRALEIPLLSIVETAVRHCSQLASGPAAKVAVLATDGTRQSGIYQRELEQHGLVPYLPSTAVQALLMDIIYNFVKAGKDVTPSQMAPVEAELCAADCELALLGCTELSVVAKTWQPDGRYLDALKLLAKNVIEYAGGEYSG